MYENSDIIQQILTRHLNGDEVRDIAQIVKDRSNGDYSSALSSILNRVSDLLNISGQLLDNLLQILIEITSSIAKAKRGTLFLLDPETDELFSRVFGGEKTIEIRFPAEKGIAGEVFSTGKAIIVENAYSDHRFNSDIDSQTGYKTNNLFCIPIRINTNNKPVGVLELVNLETMPLDKKTVEILMKVTNDSANVLKNAQQFEQIRQSHENEANLLEIASVISSELQLKPLLEKIMEAVTMILNCERATIFLLDEKRNELWSQVALGMNNQEIRFPANMGIAGEVFTTRNTVNIPDAYADDRFNQDIDIKTGYRTKNILCMPLINKFGKCIGVTQVLNKKSGGSFSRRDEMKLKSFSAQASIAVENAKLFDEVLNVKNYSESIVRSLSNGVITVNNLRKIETCNNIALKILGTTREQIIGKYADITFVKENHWIIDSLRRVIAKNTPDHFFDSEILNMKGERNSVNMSVVPLRDITDQAMGGLIVLEDLSNEKRLKGTLARYMTKEVADQLMDSEAELGGKIKELTILFADIRNFTTISEDLGPQETVAMLNEYFTTMVDIVFQHEGILDKFIGDAMLGVFGAPFSSGEDADKGVQTAIQMMRSLKQFNTKRMLQDKQTINIGIGISTDNVLVGNIGSMKRMDYTVIGDGVNLASRLEGATKFYHADILISETTYTQLKYRYWCREVDLIRVKGKLKPVKVFEVLDHHNINSFPNMEKVISLCTEGIKFYRQKKWKEAIELFNESIRLHIKDYLPKLYVQRCNFFIKNPPDESWDGVWIMTSKS